MMSRTAALGGNALLITNYAIGMARGGISMLMIVKKKVVTNQPVRYRESGVAGSDMKVV